MKLYILFSFGQFAWAILFKYEQCTTVRNEFNWNVIEIVWDSSAPGTFDVKV